MTRYLQNEPYSEFYGSKKYRENWERMHPDEDIKEDKKDKEKKIDDEEKENNESGRISEEGEEVDT